MPLGKQAAGWVGYDATAVGVVGIAHELLRGAHRGQAERLVGQELVRGEAVVQLNHANVLGRHAGRLVDVVGGCGDHVGADHLAHVLAGECGLRIGGEALCRDHDVGLQAVPAGELGAAHHRRGRATGGWAALQPRERAIDLRGREHLLDGDRVAEHRIRVVGGVLACFDGDLREHRRVDAKLVDVRLPGAAEELRRHRRLRVEGLQLVACRLEPGHRARTVGEHVGQRSGDHLLEAERQRAVDGAVGDGLAREPQRR